MKHVVFALFHDKEAANSAIDSLTKSDAAHQEHISLVAHRDLVGKAEFDQAVQQSGVDSETDIGRSALRGSVLGAAVGTVLGALLVGPLGLIAAGPVVGTLFGTGTGTVVGALSASFIGMGLTDSHLEKLAERIQKGDVLITVQTKDAETEQTVEALLRDHGAEVQEKGG